MLYTVKDDKLIKSKIMGDRKTILNLLESAKKDKTLYHSYVYRYGSI